MQKDERDESNGRAGSTSLLVTAETLRSATGAAEASIAAKKSEKDEEKVSLFWRLFGGTILSITSLVLITLYNNISTSISDLRADLNKQREAMNELIKKDDFNTRFTKVADRLREHDGLKPDMEGLRERAAANSAALDSLKKETTTCVDSFKKEITSNFDSFKKETGGNIESIKKELAVSVEGLKRVTDATSDQQKKDEAAMIVVKERIEAIESLKKDIAGIEVLKEKLATMTTDVKLLRDDMFKVQQDSDKNRSGDLERKALQEQQYRQVEDSLKDVQKALQDCREKLARLEGAIPSTRGNTSPNKP